MSSDSESDSSSTISCHDERLRSLRTFLQGVEPFYGGTSTVPLHQTSLYYTCPGPEGDVHRHVNFSSAGTDDLAALYEACQPAAFGRNGETIVDETYRKAKKMNLDAFATQFDPRSIGILDSVSKGLLLGARGSDITEMELYKLNVYGKGDFFKPHQDTPKDESMVGSLVVVLPTQHEGGQLVLRQYGKEWTLDFADTIAKATGPLVCFVAFFGDVQHEVLPVTSGYRVTLTYNLYRKPSHPSATYIPTPYHQEFKKALVELINDKSVLPEGGYLGYGLAHEYVCGTNRPLNALLDQLKGTDQVLATICKELGLSHSLTLFYRGLSEERNVNLIARYKIDTINGSGGGSSEDEFLEGVLWGLTIENVEGVEIVGRPFDVSLLEGNLEFLERFYRDPVTKILEIRPMSSVQMETPWAYYGNEALVEYVYGHVCMLITLEPAESRKELV